MTDTAIGEAPIPSHCLYAISDGETIVNERGDATIVPWWSFTKTVIAAAVLTLVRDGRLSLYSPVDGKPFTLRQLLQHRAGLPDYGAIPEYHIAVARGDVPWDIPELLDRVYSGTTFLYPPGTGWAYSNIGYLIVRQQLQRVTGTDLEAALRKLVLEPLGVKEVRLAYEPPDLDHVAMGEAAEYHPGWVYHGLLVGPVGNAAIILDKLVATDLLSPRLREQMLLPHVVGGPIADRPWRVPAYGLGMMCGESRDGHRVVGHTGGGPGSVIAIYRRMDVRSSVSAAAFLFGGTEGEVGGVAFDLASRTREDWIL
jgi:CubicO group peptidase (beta-lactamase class C family)